MPLETAGRPVRVALSLEDRDRNKSNATIGLPSTVSIVDLITNLAAIEALVAGLSNANIVDGTISIDLRQSTAWAPAAEASDVERKGVFTFATDNDGSFGKIEIPSVDNTHVMDGSNLLRLDSAPVAAFIAFMTGDTLGLGRPVNGPGHDITRLLKAYKLHRGSSKG